MPARVPVLRRRRRRARRRGRVPRHRLHRRPRRRQPFLRESPPGFASIYDPKGDAARSLGGGRIAPTTFFIGSRRQAALHEARRLPGRGARSRRTSAATRDDRSGVGRRDPRGARRRLRVVPQPVRAAARARLPVRGDRGHAEGPRQRAAAPGPGAEPAVLRELLGDLHRARPDGDGARLVAQRAPPDARARRRLDDHRARAVLPRDAVHRPPEPRMARRRAHAARRPRRSDRRRHRVRDRVDAVRRPDARRDPQRGGAVGLRPRTARTCSPGTRRAWRSRSCSRRSRSTA